jgi:hypothetical protein
MKADTPCSEVVSKGMHNGQLDMSGVGIPTAAKSIYRKVLEGETRKDFHSIVVLRGSHDNPCCRGLAIVTSFVA